MAVTKIWQVKDSLSRVLDYCNNPKKTKISDLEQVIKYAANEEKVNDENEQFYCGKSIAGLKLNQSAQNPITYLNPCH